MIQCNLAIKGQDYKNAHAYLRNKDEHCKLSFPTILMKRDDNVIGVLGTNPSKQAVIAGPLLVDDELFIMPLISAYEKILKMGSVTRYLFKVEKTKVDWLKTIDRTEGVHRRGEIDDFVIYERRL